LEFRQVLPEQATVDADELLSAIEPLRVPARRPYVLVNFISTLDGRATFQGRSGGLGDEGDRVLFHGLRERADALLVGTGTLRVERYGRMLGRAERRERRVAHGRTPEPLACLVTRTGAVPLDIPLFAEPEAKVVVFSGADVDLSGVQADVALVHVSRDELTLTTVLERLHSDFGISLLLCEGGPSLFSALLHEGLVDELLLTLAPKLAGGGPAPTLTTGSELPELAQLEPIHLLEREGSLFLRYSLRPD
jgi:riboflavin-specific deaminase-like protein